MYLCAENKNIGKVDIQALLQLYASHPCVGVLNRLMTEGTDRNILMKGLAGSAAAMTVSSLFTQGTGNFICLLNDLEEAGYFYNDVKQLLGEEMVYFFPSAYRRDIIPGANELSCLRLPQTEVGKFIDNEDSIYNYKADVLLSRRATVEVNKAAASSASKTRSTARRSRSRARYITIRSGQTLSHIAKRYGTTVSRLKRLNGLKGTSIRAGKRLRVR